MTRLACVLSLSLSLSLAIGCQSTSTRDWLPADIDSSQTLDKLGAIGMSRVCGAFEDYVRETYRSNHLIQLVCTANALEMATDAAQCAELADDCLGQLPPAVEAELQSILDQAGCNALQLTTTGCLAKVSELERCLDALGSQLETIELEATCAAFGSPIPADWWQIDPPAACASLTAEC